MSFDWGSIVEKAKEAGNELGKDPGSIVDKAKDALDNLTKDPGSILDKLKAAAGDLDPDLINDAKKALEQFANDHPNESGRIEDAARKLAFDVPTGLLPPLVSGMTFRPPQPPTPAAAPMWYASNNVYELKVEESKNYKVAPTTSAAWYQYCVISLFSPKTDRFPIRRLVFQGRGEGAKAMCMQATNSAGPQDAVLRPTTATKDGPWRIRIEFWHSQAAGAKWEKSEEFEGDRMHPGAEDSSDADKNDTQVLITTV